MHNLEIVIAATCLFLLLPTCSAALPPLATGPTPFLVNTIHRLALGSSLEGSAAWVGPLFQISAALLKRYLLLHPPCTTICSVHLTGVHTTHGALCICTASTAFGALNAHLRTACYVMHVEPGTAICNLCAPKRLAWDGVPVDFLFWSSWSLFQSIGTC